MITPVFATTFCGHATALAESLKHGSMIELPIMQRNASLRVEATELVQHEPLTAFPFMPDAA
jgi:hypothetical protein